MADKKTKPEMTIMEFLDEDDLGSLRVIPMSYGMESSLPKNR